MDQNVKLKEAVNSSFSNIYDYLAIIDSELNSISYFPSTL